MKEYLGSHFSTQSRRAGQLAGRTRGERQSPARRGQMLTNWRPGWAARWAPGSGVGIGHVSARPTWRPADCPRRWSLAKAWDDRPGVGSPELCTGAPAGASSSRLAGSGPLDTHIMAQKEEPQRAKVQPPKTCDYSLRSEDCVDVTK